MPDTEYRKMTIIPYETVDYSSERSGLEHFVAMYNPTTFNRKIEIDYESGQAEGTSAAEKKFSVIKPSDFSVELLIDGTGASPSAIGESKVDDGVQAQVDHFILVCATLDGETHSPNYLKILWGEQLFKGLLTTMDVTYTLFDKSGIPLRAKIAASFIESKSDSQRVNEDKTSSPDLTHERVVLEGDTLQLMSNRIYGDPKYYFQVAQANGLKNFRNLTPGQTIYFPPIKKA